MQAIILAAGMGKRLKELTKNNTKCMVKVIGVTLIERMLKQIDKKNLTRIVIVVGYEGKKLIDFIGTLSVQTPVCFIENPIYDKTNNIYFPIYHFTLYIIHFTFPRSPLSFRHLPLERGQEGGFGIPLCG